MTGGQTLKWNPRYLCYCRQHDKSPEAMLAFDRDRYPGGCMSGFIRWIDKHWERWCREHKVNRDVLWPKHHDAFDQWLELESEQRIDEEGGA